MCCWCWKWWCGVGSDVVLEVMKFSVLEVIGLPFVRQAGDCPAQVGGLQSHGPRCACWGEGLLFWAPPTINGVPSGFQHLHGKLEHHHFWIETSEPWTFFQERKHRTLNSNLRKHYRTPKIWIIFHHFSRSSCWLLGASGSHRPAVATRLGCRDPETSVQPSATNRSVPIWDGGHPEPQVTSVPRHTKFQVDMSSFFKSKCLNVSI